MATITLPQPGTAPAPSALEPLKVWRRQLAARLMRRRVRCRDFTIISNDCWGGMAYEELGMRYESPFVGLFVVPRDYVRLCRRLRQSIEGRIEFRQQSQHEQINQWREQIKRAYPIGVLADGVEIQFLHYRSEEEAAAKWTRRAGRINWTKLRLKISWHDDPDMESLLREFDEMPFSAKVVLAPHALAGTRHCVRIKDFSTDGTQQYWRAHKAFDIATFLDAGQLQRWTWARPIDWLLYVRY